MRAAVWYKAAPVICGGIIELSLHSFVIKIKDINILLVVCAVAGCAPARPVNSVLLAMRCFEIAGRREYFCGLVEILRKRLPL